VSRRGEPCRASYWRPPQDPRLIDRVGVHAWKASDLLQEIVVGTRRKSHLPAFEACEPGRSQNMTAIKSRGNKTTELRILEILRALRLTGWRRHLPLHGSPDFAFPKLKLAIFVNGCFWHGCPKCFRLPKTNVAYWTQKIGRNIRRDRRNSRLLRREGWSVLHIWEHSIRQSEPAVTKRISRTVEARRRKFECKCDVPSVAPP
jgi:DNA mismatch endonuclease (patch repair protein)